MSALSVLEDGRKYHKRTVVHRDAGRTGVADGGAGIARALHEDPVSPPGAFTTPKYSTRTPHWPQTATDIAGAALASATARERMTLFIVDTVDRRPSYSANSRTRNYKYPTSFSMT